MRLAEELGLPVIIHSREAHAETAAVLEEYALRKKGIIHCFTGGARAAEKFVSLGYLIGIGGVITFPNAGELKEAVREMELDNMVLETDAPWLAPQQERGKRNEPAYITHVVSEIARIKGVSREEVERTTSANAAKMFGF